MNKETKLAFFVQKLQQFINMFYEGKVLSKYLFTYLYHTFSCNLIIGLQSYSVATFFAKNCTKDLLDEFLPMTNHLKGIYLYLRVIFYMK